MFNFLLSFVLGHLPWFWLIAFALAMFVASQLPLARAWIFKELVPLLTVGALGFVACWMYSDHQTITDLRQKNSELDLKATNLEVKIDAYRDGLKDYQEDQRKIRAQIKAVKQGLSASSIIQESHNDPVKADSDLNSRWRDLDGMFDNATSGTEPSAAPAAGADAEPAG